MNTEGGETGSSEEGLDQAGRSCGSNAAVQSRPIHHLWFSWTVNKKRRDAVGGATAPFVFVFALALVMVTGWLEAGLICGGRGSPERRDQSL